MFHCQIKPVQRSKGRSAVAAAAYRAREKLMDNRQGMEFNYSSKQDLIHKEIIGFSGSREQLWNLAEFSEKRKDARTAVEYEIALPRELTNEQNIILANKFGQWLNQNYGVAVDICIHQDADNNNPHAHILTTTRAVENGNGLSALKVARDWSDAKRGKAKLCKSKLEIVNARKNWATIHNDYCEELGINKVIDHRSYKDQGIKKMPTIHIGPIANEKEKRGEKSRLGNINREINELNNEIKISHELTQKIKELEDFQLVQELPRAENESLGSNKFDDFLRPTPVIEYTPKKKKEIEVKKKPKQEQSPKQKYYQNPQYDGDGIIRSWNEIQIEKLWLQKKELERMDDKLWDSKRALDFQIRGTKAFIEKLNTGNLKDYHSMVHRIKNKGFFTKLGFKIGLLKINVEPPRIIKISEHKALILAKETHEKAKQELKEFKDNMEIIDVEAVPQIEQKPTPKIEQEYNVNIELGVQNTTLSEEPTTGFNVEELQRAAEQEFKKLEDEIKPKNNPSHDDNSPSF